MKQRRTCNECQKPILKLHRWKTVHHEFKILGFTLFRWSNIVHRDCQHPTEIHKNVRRLKGEVPLPFPDDGVKYQPIPENPEVLRAPADDVRKQVLDRGVPMDVVLRAKKHENLTIEEVDAHGI